MTLTNLSVKLIIALLFVFIPFGIHLHSQDPLKRLEFINERQKSFSMPFKLVHNLIVIPVKINDSRVLNFILDTGLSTTLITELSPDETIPLVYAREVKLQGLGKGGPLNAIHSFGNEIRILDIIGKNQDIYIVPENILNLSARLGMPVNGILGYSLFSSFIVKIDYSASTIHFYDPEQFEYKRRHRRYRTIPLVLHETKPYITMEIYDNDLKKFEIKVLLDTGASHALWINPASLNQFSIPPKTYHTFLGYGLNGEIFGDIFRLSKLNIGEYSFKYPVVSFPDSGSINYARDMDNRNGSVGGEVLKRFKLIIDYSNNTLKVRANSYFRNKFTYNLSGIEVTAPYHPLPLYVIEDVRKDSPASRAGLQQGDEISSINGQPANRMQINDIYHILHSDPGTKIRLRVLRDGKPVNISFRLDELF